MRPSDTRLGVLTTPKSWKLSELACRRTLIAPGPGGPGSGSSIRSNSIQAARRFDDDGFHDDLQFKREATDSFARLETLVRTARPSARVYAVSIGAVAHAPGRKTGEEREPWSNRGAVGEQHTF